MIFAAPVLGGLGFEADAHGCRQFSAGVSMLAARRHAGTLPRVAILALGAYGTIPASGVRAALRAIGRHRILGLVTPRNLASSQTRMRRAAGAHPNRVLLIDWARYSAGHGSWFGGDGLHVNQSGARAFARLVRRRVAPLVSPPVEALRMPRTLTGRRGCGAVRRAGRTWNVFVVRGARLVSCARARVLARRSPLRQGRNGVVALDEESIERLLGGRRAIGQLDPVAAAVQEIYRGTGTDIRFEALGGHVRVVELADHMRDTTTFEK